MQINNSLEEYKDTSTSRARLMSLVMLTVLFLNTRTWSFPKLDRAPKKTKKFASYNFPWSLILAWAWNKYSSKKARKNSWVPFQLYHSSLLADHDTITDCLLAYSSKQERKCRPNKSKPHRTSAGRLMFLWY